VEFNKKKNNELVIGKKSVDVIKRND